MIWRILQYFQYQRSKQQSTQIINEDELNQNKYLGLQIWWIQYNHFKPSQKQTVSLFTSIIQIITINSPTKKVEMKSVQGKIVFTKRVISPGTQTNFYPSSTASSQNSLPQTYTDDVKHMSKNFHILSSQIQQLVNTVDENTQQTASLKDSLQKINESLNQNVKTTNLLVQALTSIKGFFIQLAENSKAVNQKNNEKTSIKQQNPQNVNPPIFITKAEQFQQRDRLVFSNTSHLSQPLQKKEIQMWTAEMCQQVFSSAFHKYQNEYFTLDQAKAYCAQNIINNIILLSEKNQLNVDNIKWIDEHFHLKVAPYMLMKYPLAENNIINKQLQNCVKQIDNMQNLNCNLFYKFSQTCFDFKYRQDGNYNDLIMRFVNFLIEYPDKSPDYILRYMNPSNFTNTKQAENKGNTTTSIYQNFTNQMKLLFDVDNQKDPNNQKNMKKDSSWSISRKVDQNVPMYTEHEIKNQEILIKHPSILRILTKWCVQLSKKFQQNYFLNNFDYIFNTQGRKIINVCDDFRRKINQELQEEKKIIDKFYEEIQNNKYYQYVSRIKESLDAQQFTNMSKLQRSNGLFTVNTIEALHLDVVVYLNKIIHCLLRVAKNGASSVQSLKTNDYIPNLLSFTVGDLLRCRYTAKQSQIKRMYDQIIYKDRNNSNIFKIVRTKNRLRENTNDIEILFLFQQHYLCEIQLVVESQQTKSMLYTNKFNHFIYELKRSIFGPISQLCSVRNNFDKRAKIYREMAYELTREQNKRFQCQHGTQYFKKFTLPFECSVCGFNSTRLACIESNFCCAQCEKTKQMFRICGRCRLKNYDQMRLKDFLLQDIRQYQNKNLKFIARLQNNKTSYFIPKYGVFFPVNINVKKSQEFLTIKTKKKYEIYGQNDKNEVILLQSLCSENEIAKFKKDHIVFQFDTIPQSLQKLSKDNKIKTYELKKTIETVSTQQKELINFMKKGLDSQKCEQIFKGLEETDKIDKIKLLDLSFNHLTEISFLRKFGQLKSLFLGNNRLKKIDQIKAFPYLEILYIDNNGMEQFPEEVTELSRLKELQISNNSFNQLPSKISLLKSLQKLSASNLNLTSLPESMKQLGKLKQVNLSHNQFTEIPKELEAIKTLQILQINQNQIREIDRLVQQLPNLKILQLNDNHIDKLPLQIVKLQKLEKLQLHQNELTSLNLKLPSKLKHLDLSDNNITSMNSNIFDNLKKQLLSLNISNNNLHTLPTSLFQCYNLQVLDVSVSQNTKSIEIKSLFEYRHIVKLKELKKLNLSGAKGVQVSDLSQLNYITTLQELCLSNMNLDVLPQLTSLKYLAVLNVSKNELQVLSCIDKLYTEELVKVDFSDNLEITRQQLSNLCAKLKKEHVESGIVDNRLQVSIEDLLKKQESPYLSISFDGDDFSDKIYEISRQRLCNLCPKLRELTFGKQKHKQILTRSKLYRNINSQKWHSLDIDYDDIYFGRTSSIELKNSPDKGCKRKDSWLYESGKMQREGYPNFNKSLFGS